MAEKKGPATGGGLISITSSGFVMVNSAERKRAEDLCAPFNLTLAAAVDMCSGKGARSANRLLSDMKLTAQEVGARQIMTFVDTLRTLQRHHQSSASTNEPTPTFRLAIDLSSENDRIRALVEGDKINEKNKFVLFAHEL
jgi:hypothetical protein